MKILIDLENPLNFGFIFEYQNFMRIPMDLYMYYPNIENQK
jgi:hypothetical protein